MQRKAAGKEIQNPEQHEGISEDISVRLGMKYEYTSIAYFVEVLFANRQVDCQNCWSYEAQIGRYIWDI